ncbi:unnamed protein product [Cyclocybe aegerita]|uniref:Ubiquitin 3 binding protein But2 C-terminal domain-containing protein n=1 Tax=Cyclocybe aegerita TaxID=1973307 RepID=A0A8S0VRW1_CYCAE|nr:unnamed protein product [Cyclocybe aegerita]
MSRSDRYTDGIPRNGEYDEDRVSYGHPRSANNKPSASLSLALILFFIVDIAAFLVIAKMLLNVTSTFQNEDEMEFRNPYFGLDELYAQHRIQSSVYPKIVNEPKLAAQISSAEPDKIFPVDLHQWLSDFGRLSPPDRRLQVSKDIHTIIQHNVLDYGMEKCAIAIRLPARGDALPHPYTLPPAGDTVRLSICELDAKRPLKEHTLSWSKRPPCVRQLVPVDAKIGGEVELEPFACKSDSYLTYQISCAEDSPGCNVDVWTNHNQTWGVFINQYQTL